MMGARNSGFGVQAAPGAPLAAASFGSDYVMEPKRVITASQAAALVPDNCTITTGGFGSCGHPDLLTEALAARFADKIAVLHQGQLHETLSARELREHGGSPWLQSVWAALPEQQFFAPRAPSIECPLYA